MFGPNWPKNGEIGTFVQSIMPAFSTNIDKISSRVLTTNHTTT
jgi:hypothetical protein